MNTLSIIFINTKTKPMAQNKLSFELTAQLKAEFETYLYNEALKNKASGRMARFRL